MFEPGVLYKTSINERKETSSLSTHKLIYMHSCNVHKRLIWDRVNKGFYLAGRSQLRESLHKAPQSPPELSVFPLEGINILIIPPDAHHPSSSVTSVCSLKKFLSHFCQNASFRSLLTTLPHNHIVRIIGRFKLFPQFNLPFVSCAAQNSSLWCFVLFFRKYIINSKACELFTAGDISPPHTPNNLSVYISYNISGCSFNTVVCYFAGVLSFFFFTNH